MLNNYVYVWLGLIIICSESLTQENKKLISELFSKPVFLYDANTFKLIAKFTSHKNLIKEFKISTKTVIKYKDSGKIFRNKYIISSI